MSWIDRLAGTILGENATPDQVRPVIGLDMFSSWLPWRAFLPDLGIFLNASSMGFAMEMPPFVGADERTADILAQFFQEGLPKGACVQIICWGSPRVSRRIGDWFLPRYKAGPFYQMMGRHRAQFLADGV